MRHLGIMALSLAATPALADFERMEAQGTVSEAFSRLENAVEGAGATIFATVDHGQGAAGADMNLGPMKLLIFGNPEVDTPMMQQDPMAGIVLPLRMLVYAEGNQTYVAYEDVEEMFDDLDVDDDLKALEKMEAALERFANAAAGN